MNPIFAIAEKMLVDRLMSNKAPLTGESKLKLILLIFSGLMAVGTIGLTLYATFLWLSANLTPIAVMFSMAGITAILSLLALGVFFAINVIKRRIIKQKRDEMIAMASDTLKILNYELSEPIKDNPLTSTLVASIVGYISAKNIL